MMDKREQVNRNYSRALRYIKFNQCLIYPLFGIGIFMLLGFLAGDYFIGYDFFSKLAENDLGVIPYEKQVGVALKSILPLAVAVSLKFAFLAMPKAIQRMLIAALLFVVVVTVLSTGAAQVIPMMIDGAERIFPGEAEFSNDLKALLGESSDPQQEAEVEQLTPEAQEKISKSRFITEFDRFGRAYMLMTTAAVFTWLAIAGLYNRMQTIRQLKHSIVKRYGMLLDKERQRDIFIEARDYLKSSMNFMCRLAQDHVVNAYVAGLGHPEFHLAQLKLYGSQNRAHRMFSRFQVYRFRWLRFINIRTAEESMSACYASIENLKLVEPEDESEPLSKVIQLAKRKKTERSERHETNHDYDHHHSVNPDPSE